MKKTFKFTFAALALATLASCSSDDLFNGNSQAQQEKGKNGIVVEVEDMVDPLTMRAAFEPTSDGGQIYWQTGDVVRILDKDLTKYDKYTYDEKAKLFVPASATDNIIKDPVYALFENGGVDGHHWEYDTKSTEATYKIPAAWEWEEAYDSKDANSTKSYLSNLPLWGTAEADAEYGVKVELLYLTGVVRVDMKNVPGNVKAIKMKGWLDQAAEHPAQLNGTFNAVLGNDITGIDYEAILVPTKENGDITEDVDNVITVDLTGATDEETTVFIPLVCQKYGRLEFYYTKADNTDEFIQQINEVTIERKRYYRIYKGLEFVTAGHDIPALNRAIGLHKDETEDVTITTSQKTLVTQENNTISLDGIQTKKLTLDLQGFYTNDNATLNIVDQDYDGELIIKLPEDAVSVTDIGNMTIDMPKAKLTFAGNWGQMNLGEYNNATEAFELRKMVVKALTVSAKATMGNIYVNSESGKDNTGADINIAANATISSLILQDNTNIDNITVNGNVEGDVDAAYIETGEKSNIVVTVTMSKTTTVGGTVKTNQTAAATVPAGADLGGLTTDAKTVTVQGTVGTLTARKATTVTVNNADAEVETIDAKAATKVVISAGKVGTLEMEVAGEIELSGTGEIATAINCSDATKMTISSTKELEVEVNLPKAAVVVNETAKVSGDITAKTLEVSGTKATVKNATVSEKATIQTDEVAVTGTLTIADKKTLDLKAGYINELTCGGTTGLTFINVEDEMKPTGIKTVTTGTNLYANAAATKPVAYTSVWGGAKVTGTGYVPAATVNNIYTASQYAAHNNTTVVLQGNIDLNNIEVAPKAAINVEFDGNFKTISNVNVAKSASGYAGLFQQLSASATVKNLCIDGITVNHTYTAATTANVNQAVGALAGYALGGTITNVDVKNAELSSNNWTVGGLIGYVNGTVTITGRTAVDALEATNKFSTVEASITGKNRLGGLVGYISATGIVTVSNYKSVPTLEATETLNAAKSNRANFGTVAPFVGSAAAGASLSVTETAGTTGATTALTMAQMKANGFQNNMTTGDDGKTVYYFYCRKAIGYVDGTSTSSQFTLNSTALNGDTKNDTEAAAKTAASGLNQYLKETVWP